MELIVAVDEKNGISKNNRIPWKCKEDMEWFKEKTEHNVVVMGKTTFLTLPKGPLTNRLNIVFTRNPEVMRELFPNYENVLFTDNLHILNVRFEYPFLRPNYTTFVIGGKQIYNLFLPKVRVVWLTRILQDCGCDQFFHFHGELLAANDWMKETIRQHRNFDIFKYSRMDYV
jgi:dihydrofolate reductase